MNVGGWRQRISFVGHFPEIEAETEKKAKSNCCNCSCRCNIFNWISAFLLSFQQNA